MKAIKDMHVYNINATMSPCVNRRKIYLLLIYIYIFNHTLKFETINKLKLCLPKETPAKNPEYIIPKLSNAGKTYQDILLKQILFTPLAPPQHTFRCDCI